MQSEGHRSPNGSARNKERCRMLEWRDNGAGVAGIFVREIAGGSDGPTLLVTAGEHGIELSPVGGIDSLCRSRRGCAPRRSGGSDGSAPRG